ncbi:MAG: gamma-glutamyltransferase, partial [Candidatus Eremiobacteraeota bacterium]|nr:gamma-glutamyltransferase [Candidatus Eremiobacteraeota bacterium]
MGCFFAVAALASNASRVPAAQPARGIHGMVVTEQRYASEIGLHILKTGGNAVDAAVAVGYALAVVDPCCGNIGGGGFMLIRTANGKETFLDFRERAPLRATRDMFLDAKGNVVPGRSTKTYLGVAIPGTVKGLEFARTRFGTKTRGQLLSPAIALARNGYV